MDSLRIERIGRQGDGISVDDAGREQFVPFALPGERVKTRRKDKFRVVEEILEPSPERIAPLCQHFGDCGGCQTQHFSDELYRKWKTGLLRDVLDRETIATDIEPLIDAGTSARRKAVFSVQRLDGVLRFGFLQSASNHVTDLQACPVLTPGFQKALPALRAFAATLPAGKKPARLSVLETENGFDVAIELNRSPGEHQKLGLVRKAVELDFARLSAGDEVLIESRKPYLVMGGAKVIVPPGGFVQASAKAEEKMVRLVCEHLAACKWVADLYCGVGTFALRLAEKSKVWALEENLASVEHLLTAWKATGGILKEIRAEKRNLDRRPATFQEFKKMDGLVFDPPRAGAEMQARQIAKSRIGRVAAVSCNPATLARDIRILLEGGFQLRSVHPIDQFRYTPHVEVVALLEK